MTTLTITTTRATNCSCTKSDNNNDGKLSPTEDVLAFYHQRLARKAVPDLLDGTGSIVDSGTTAVFLYLQ